jgi:protein ImuB
LESLAAWADEITPLVVLVPPDGLVLEIRGSLRLLGGLDAIKRRVCDAIVRVGSAAELAAAPTLLGALWLARHRGADVLTSERLRSALNPLPLSVTDWPEDIQALLSEMGLDSVGDCLRLPRDGFARRVGVAYLDELDKALGRQADPRPGFETPRRWSSKIAFSEETDDLEVLSRALAQVVDALVDSLRRQQRQVQGLELVLHHLRHSATRSRLQLVEPTHRKDRLLEPLCARLSRIVLPRPAIACSVFVDELQTLTLEEDRLFGDHGEPSPRSVSPAVLVERLRGRFGIESVYGFELVEEHRPERVCQKLTERLLETPPHCARLSPYAHDRPLWLLPAPIPYADGVSKLRYRGSLRVASEAERIESGWWDTDDISRDYYTAATEQGEKLWVYRDRVTDGWFIHGIFG